MHIQQLIDTIVTQAVKITELETELDGARTDLAVLRAATARADTPPTEPAPAEGADVVAREGTTE